MQADKYILLRIVTDIEECKVISRSFKINCKKSSGGSTSHFSGTNY